jgi:hypothetical protein
VSADNLIRIMCPNLSCQRILAVPVAARGKVVRCRVCGMNVRIPEGKAGAPQPSSPAPTEKAAKAPASGREGANGRDSA